jgi:hypothetical protein
LIKNGEVAEQIVGSQPYEQLKRTISAKL